MCKFETPDPTRVAFYHTILEVQDQAATNRRFVVNLTQDYLKSILYYCPDKGLFTWKVRLSRRTKIGSKAGTLDSVGHRQIRINKKHYFVHRLAFLYITGEWPKNYVGHIDDDMDNNSWSNLRAATAGQNQVCRPLDSRNSSGYKGVSKTRNGTWRAQLCKDGVKHRLGTYKTPELAHEAYLKGVSKHFGEEFCYV